MEEADITSERYFEHNLQFYDECPSGLILLDDLETLVLERLSILQTVVKIAVRNKTKSASSCLEIFVAQLRKDEFGSFAALCDGSGNYGRCSQERFMWRRRDHVSHTMLLICMAQKPVTLNWFLEAETLLFKWRLSGLNIAGINFLMTLKRIKYPEVTEREKRLLKNYLKPAMKHLSSFNSTEFYKVPIFEILDALEERHIFVKSGIAYATKLQLRTALFLRYKRHLACRAKKLVGVQNFLGDPRMFVLIERVQQTFSKANLAKKPTSKDGVALDELDEVAATSFPPCMRRIHEGLREQHHLRNKDRFQYTTYLKAIGIAAEDAIEELYRKEFTKKMTDEIFTKKYAHNFRYIYGFAGAKQEYRVPSCSSLAKDTPGRKADEFHGCPMADIEDLDELLTHWDTPRAPTNKIIALAKSKKCSAACAAFFEVSHEAAPKHRIKNPMDFYRQSVKFHPSDYAKFRLKKKAEAKAGEKVLEQSEESESSSDDSEGDCAVDPRRMSTEDREKAIKKKLMEFYNDSSIPTA